MGGKGSGRRTDPATVRLKKHILNNKRYTNRQLAGLLVTNNKKFSRYGFERLADRISALKTQLRYSGKPVPKEEKQDGTITASLREAQRKGITVHELQELLARKGRVTSTRSLYTRAKQLGLTLPSSVGRKAVQRRSPHRH